MKRIAFLLLSISVLFASCLSQDQKVQESKQEQQMEYPKLVGFPSLDSLLITAHLYQIDKTSPFILLCHQAGYNKFEYAGTAERLNEMGFNCLAMDQRSGGPIGNTQNETYLRAIAKGKAVAYHDAEVDMVAAINYLTENYTEKVILWGSSYSSALALYIGVENDKVEAVVSFSPGDYLAEVKGTLVDKLEGFSKPMFLTSAKRESKYVEEILKKHDLGENQVHFVPETPGHHGSRALWINQKGGEEYWKAITAFLEQIKQK